MDEFFDLPTLIVIGVAIVVLFRLRSVLGTRTGNERPPLERPRAESREENVVPMRPRPAEPQTDADAERFARKLEAEIEQYSHGDEQLAAGLRAIAEADPNFTPKSFLEGAKAAYEMIVTGFAAGDRKTLKMLLEKDVYDGFERAISEREAAGHTVDFTFVGLPKIEISEAQHDKRIAEVTIRFNAEVVSATRDAEGNLIEGNADQVASIADEWTFARSTKSRDPNWKLVATNQLD
ncbi:calcium-binding protein [Arsenicitalea aurantiaca]|uniref:Calcium-binding protein n=1 Tax=Arsenicitalea aurantiaca TaxID=1783274 RepID=A0A433X7X5_9HYPH|nr:Tim44/TimA family putative adaptor protein [Arsenicitalea aurantiaca]RUT30153.1 calcium-binding protein [Arsenicitalea aurantiaca]